MKHNRLIAGMLALAVMGSAAAYGGGHTMSSIVSYASENVEYYNVKYFINDAGEAVVKGYTGSPERIIIDSYILDSQNRKIPVKYIGEGAFADCETATSVEIPSTVEIIGQNAFRHCTGLTSVVIPSNVESIGNYAFAYCFEISHITFSTGPKTIGFEAFFCDLSLLDVKLPSTVSEIGNGAFGACDSLRALTIPNKACTIFNSGEVVYNDKVDSGCRYKGWLFGEPRSTTESYAKAYGYTFLPIGAATGDVNFDYSCDSSDAALVLKYYSQVQAKQTTSFTANAKAMADYNADGAIDSSDAALILRTYANNQSK